MKTTLILIGLAMVAVTGCGDDTATTPPPAPGVDSGSSAEAGMMPAMDAASPVLDSSMSRLDGMVVDATSDADAMVDPETRADCMALCGVVDPCFSVPEVMCVETCAGLIGICTPEERVIIRECSMLSDCPMLGACFMRVGCLSSLAAGG